MDDTSLAQISGEIFCHSSQIILFSCSLLESFCFSTFHFKIPLQVFHWLQVGGHTWIGHSFQFFTLCVIFGVCLGSLSCWKTSLLPSFLRLGGIFSLSIWVCKLAFMVPSINVISPTPFALMQHISAHSNLHVSRLALCSHL